MVNGLNMKKRLLKLINTFLNINLIFIYILGFDSHLFAADEKKGMLKELKLDSSNEDENVKRAATTEALISKSEEKALQDIDKLLKKYKGTDQEPDLLFRKAELFVRRAKSGRFFDLYRGEKSLDQILRPDLKQKGAKDYLNEGIRNYSLIESNFKKYTFMDEVYFNMGFAFQQLGNLKSAQNSYESLLTKFPDSKLKWETHMAIGDILFIDQKYEDAIQHFKQLESVSESPLYPLALYKRAWCHYNLRDTERGIKYLEKVLELSSRKDSPKHLRNEARRDLGLYFVDSKKSADALNYFKKLLNLEEMAKTFDEMSEMHNRHNKPDEAILLLVDFITEYPKTEERIPIHLKLLNTYHNFRLDKEMMSSLKDLHTYCVTNKKTNCYEKLKPFENNLLAEWWEKWNKNKTNLVVMNYCKEVFPLYFELENKDQPEIDMHFAYAEIVFQAKDFKTAAREYNFVAHQDKATPTEKHTALYGAIVSYNEVKVATPKNEFKEPELLQLHKLLTEYLTLYKKGEYFSQVSYQKAFLHFEYKEWADAEKLFLTLQKSNNKELKEKSEDLIFEIYNQKEEFEKLKNFSYSVYQNTIGLRKDKIKDIYQKSQLKLIELLLKDGKEAAAANGYILFHQEHLPSLIASQALESAIPLYFKNHLYEEGAMAAEKRAIELKEEKDKKSKAEYLNKSIQAWLFIGQLDKALVDTLSVVDTHPDVKEQKNALLLAENLSQLTENQDILFKIWKRLPTYLEKNEKELFFLTQKKYFDDHPQLDEAKVFYKKIESDKIEPFYSEIAIKKAINLFDNQKYNEAFNLCKSIQNTTSNNEIKARARMIQAQVLELEFSKQSIKAQPDRVPLVLAMKTEKMDKAISAYTSALTLEPLISNKITILNYMNRTYSGYISAIEGFLLQDTAGIDPELIGQLKEVLEAMKAKSLETSQSITMLDSKVKEDAQLKVTGQLQTKPTIQFLDFQLDWPTQDQYQIYLPSWNESQPQLWTNLNDIKAQIKNCSIDKSNKISTPTFLGLKINQCLKFKKQTEVIELTNTFLKKYPLSPWGAYYRSVFLYMTGHTSASLWYLELALKKDKENSLVQYEKARQIFLVEPIESINIWTNVFSKQSDLEEAKLFLGLQSFTKEECKFAPQYFENVHRKSSIDFVPRLLILSECYSKSQRIVESSQIIDKALKNQTSVLLLIQRARIALVYEKNKTVALTFFEKAKAISDNEEVKKSLQSKIEEIKR